MTWIKTVPPTEATPELLQAKQAMQGMYPPEYRFEPPSLKDLASRANGGGISDSHSLLPQTLYHAFATLGSLLSPELPLTRAQHEMIATVVSTTNHCFY